MYSLFLSSLLNRCRTSPFNPHTTMTVGRTTLSERWWPCPFSQKRKYSQCSRYFSGKLPSRSCNSLSMYPARGFTEPLGAQQTGQYSNMPFAPTTTLRDGTMASIAEPPDVASCRCTFLSSSFTERLCWQPSRSAWCLRRNWREYSAASTANCRQRSFICGTSLRPVKDQRNVYWKPVLISTGPQKSKC